MGLSKEHKAELDAAMAKHSDIFKGVKDSGVGMTPYVESLLDEMEIIRQKYIDEQWQKDDERLTKLRLQKEADGKKFLGYDTNTFEPIYED